MNIKEMTEMEINYLIGKEVVLRRIPVEVREFTLLESFAKNNPLGMTGQIIGKGQMGYDVRVYWNNNTFNSYNLGHIKAEDGEVQANIDLILKHKNEARQFPFSLS